MEEVTDSYIKVAQLSQPEIVPRPATLRPNEKQQANNSNNNNNSSNNNNGSSSSSSSSISSSNGESLLVSPFKSYYAQLAWGKLISWFQPMMSHHFSGNEVWPNIWISNFGSICELQPLLDRNITHIISAVLGVEPLFPKHIQYTKLPLRDIDEEDIYQYFDKVSDIIHNDVSQGKSVLVNCRCGVSRSTTLVCAYLIKYHNMSATKAIRTIQEKRPCANPIPAFRHQLRSFEERGGTPL
jgi:protein-tyrosine phosphatase